MKNKIKYKKHLSLIILVILSFVPLFDLLHPGLPVTHDGQDHVARIANFYQNLKEGNIIPRWAANLNWGYGHPILMFLYPLPSYLASLFHFFGFSLVDSVKIVFGLGFVASGLAMYVWLKEFLGTKSAFIGGILYMFAPYRFVDLYVRGAIGEHVAFIFPPLICYFLLKLSRKYSNFYILGCAFSFAGFMLSHNAIMIMFFPIILAYAFYLLFTSKESFCHLRGVGLIMFLGIGLAAFFWIPAFFEGKYTLRDIVTSGGEYKTSFVMWKDFFFSPWSYGGTLSFSKQIGFIHWIGIFGSIISICILYKKNNKLWIMSLAGFLILGITLFLMTSLSNPIWQSITLLQKFQFPWRFLSVGVFVTAVLGGLAVSVIPKRVKLLTVYVLVFAVLFFNKDFWRAKDYLIKPESFFTGVYYGTTDTGESAPIWSVRFMEKRPKRHIEMISGEASIKEISRKSTVHIYEIDATKRSRILENTLYFPGWNVFVNGRKVEVEFQDTAFRGLMTFYVDSGKHNVEIKFGETKLRLFADIISAAALGIIIFLSLRKRLRQMRNL